MNEFELHQYLNQHPLTQRHFQGVFARDELRYQEFTPYSLYVVNTDARRDPGTHWLLCAWDAIHNAPLYFDSYGLAPFHPEIESFLLQTSPMYCFNKHQLQSDNSDVCGHYVAYVATQLSAGLTLPQIRQQFSRNFIFNDKLVVTLFRKEFGFSRSVYKETREPMSCQCLFEYGRCK